jgi:NAD(P)-dependent dehydrogenase (short-subunit alcohol dehydrogenase family)
MPRLISLAKADPTAKPALLVTQTLIYLDPYLLYFALSMVKSAQRNLVQSLAKTYTQEGVHVGVVTVGGIVRPHKEKLNPTYIAARTWEWFGQPREKQTFEVMVMEDDPANYY